MTDWINESIIAISQSSVEHVRILFFDKNDSMLAKWHYSIGNRHRVPCTTSFVVNMARECDARSFLMLHNHPSGSYAPSDIDIRFTEQLKNHAMKHGVHLVDHIVCAATGAASILDSLPAKVAGIEAAIPGLGQSTTDCRSNGGSIPNIRRPRRSPGQQAETKPKLVLPSQVLGGVKS